MNRILRSNRTPGGAIVLGRGLLAAEFLSQPGGGRNWLIVACGVSNSMESRPSAYLRERRVITQALRSRRRVIVFGSIAANPLSLSRYYRNKWQVERRIARRKEKALSIRLPQVFGHGGNENNLVNTFYQRMERGLVIPLFSGALRQLISAHDLPSIVRRIIATQSKFRRLDIAHNAAMAAEDILACLAEAGGFKPDVSVLPRQSGFSFSGARFPRTLKYQYRLPEYTERYLRSELRAYVQARN